MPAYPRRWSILSTCDGPRTSTSSQNLYVYFWRWATWKVFGGARESPLASWLSSPPPGIHRAWALGDARVSPALGRIEDGSSTSALRAIVPMCQHAGFPRFNSHSASRYSSSTGLSGEGQTSAIRFRSLAGSREQKFEQLDNLGLRRGRMGAVRADRDRSSSSRGDGGLAAVAAASGDLIPWTTLGVKTNRNWVSAPSLESCSSCDGRRSLGLTAPQGDCS